MPDASSVVRPGRHSSAEQDTNLTVHPLFAEGRRSQDGERDGSGVGLLLHRSVGQVVTVGDIMSTIDDMLRDMALEGYLLPAAQSEVVKTLKEIRRTGKIGMLS